MSRIIRTRSSGPSKYFDGVPVYALVTAGGLFRDNAEQRLIGRIHPPENLKSVTRDYFLVRIEGRSMEPRIPSGSYCYCRFFTAGGRSGRTVLVEERKIAECAYTMKRCQRIRGGPGEPDRIILKSDNPEQPNIEISEDGESQDQRYAMIAEFVEVLKEPLNWVRRMWGPADE